jgi:hypothetical protein
MATGTTAIAIVTATTPMYYHNLLIPSLTPNTILDLHVPTTITDATGDRSIVKPYSLGEYKDQPPLGQIQRISLSVEHDLLALADSTSRVTLARLPKEVEEEDNADNAEAEEDEGELDIVGQFKVKKSRKSDEWVGLEVTQR